MNKQVFIINGGGGVGKDTFISLVNKAFKYSKFNKSNNPVMNFSSVDKVKKIATMIGWNGEKTEKDRKLLYDLKSLTTEYNDMSFNSMKEKVSEFKFNDSTMLFLHVREPIEIERAKTEFNALTVLSLLKMVFNPIIKYLGNIVNTVINPIKKCLIITTISLLIIMMVS